MDLYKEEVMDHYEHPRNQGSFDDIQDINVVEGRDSNASCGDMLQFQLKIEEGLIKEVRWRGIGCAISTAAASKLSVWLEGMKLDEVKMMSEEEMTQKGIGFLVNPGREKCLTLPSRVIRQILES